MAMNPDAKPLQRLLVFWIDACCRFAKYVTLAAVLLTGATVYYSASYLRINTNTGDMIDRSVPYRQGWEAFKQAFPQFVDTIVIVIDGETADLADDAAEKLGTELETADTLFRDVYRPDSDPFFLRHGLLYLDIDELDEIAVRLADAQPLLAELSRDPSLRGLFKTLDLAADAVADGREAPGLDNVFDGVASVIDAQLAERPEVLSWQEIMMGSVAAVDERRRIMIAQVADIPGEVLQGTAAIAKIRELVAVSGYTETSGVKVRLTGPIPLSFDELKSAAAGAKQAGIISVLLVCGLLTVGLGSVRLVVATLATLAMGLSWSAGFATLAVGHLNLISVAFAVLFVGLGVDFGIHLGLRYREAVNAGAAHRDAMREAASGVGGALVLCAVAAAIGFFSFVGTEFIGLSELGIISGGSMFIALIANLTLMPALLTLMPLAARGGTQAKAGASLITGQERLLRRHGGKVVAAAALLGLAGAVLVPQVRFDFDPLHLKDPDSESASTFVELQRDSRASTHSLSVLTDSLDEATDLAARFEKLDSVDGTRTIADYVPKEQDEKLEIVEEIALFLIPVLDPPKLATPPDTAEIRAGLIAFRATLARLAAADAGPVMNASATRLLDAIDRFVGAKSDDAAAMEELSDRLLATLASRLARLRQSLNADFVAIDALPDRIRSREVATDGRYRVQVFPAEDLTDNDALRRYVVSVTEVAPDATGGPVIILGAGDAVTQAMQKAVLTAFAAISLLLLIMLRNVLDSLLVLLPLSLASVLTLASSVLLGLPFNFANVIVLPLLLSLGVASGIHLVMRARTETADTALSETSTPRAVVFSALTTIGSFGSLAVSSHRGTASMGELLTIAIFFTLACTLIVLPALMSAVRKYRPARAATVS